MFNWYTKRRLLWGDWLVLALSLVVTSWAWTGWGHTTQAQKCQIRQGTHNIGTFDLNQDRHIRVRGAIGESVIHIRHGKVRMEQAPCQHQYCVQQGWLSHAGQVALCLPNQVSIVLLGNAGFDSLSY